MLDSKSTVYWVYAEDESNGCVTQLLQLINFNENAFQNNSVGLYINIKLLELGEYDIF